MPSFGLIYAIVAVLSLVRHFGNPSALCTGRTLITSMALGFLILIYLFIASHLLSDSSCFVESVFNLSAPSSGHNPVSLSLSPSPILIPLLTLP